MEYRVTHVANMHTLFISFIELCIADVLLQLDINSTNLIALYNTSRTHLILCDLINKLIN